MCKYNFTLAQAIDQPAGVWTSLISGFDYFITPGLLSAMKTVIVSRGCPLWDMIILRHGKDLNHEFIYWQYIVGLNANGECHKWALKYMTGIRNLMELL